MAYKLKSRKKAKFFTVEEDAVLRASYMLGEADWTIAERIGCTVKQVKNRRYKLKLTAKGTPLAAGVTRVGCRWTAECDRVLADLHREGKSDAQIAKELRRTEQAVCYRRKRLKLSTDRSAARTITATKPTDVRRLMYVSAEGEVLDPLRVSHERLTGGRFCGFIISSSGDKKVI